jgi:hypothetical protein
MRQRFSGWSCAVLAAVVGLGCTSSLPPGGPPPADRPPAGEPLPGPGRLLGAGGCAARGCHGGPAATPDGEPRADWSNASTFWARYDKHALAHANLRSDLATAMVARLRESQPDAGWRDAAVEPRCLACHVTPQLATVNEPQARSEGVSCDACHTLPGRTTTEWLGPHQFARSTGWSDEAYTKHGLRRLDGPARRAEVCVGCHVGAPATDGVPVREVTHDLIAAGHPRLNFEFVTYLALMPPHWVERSPGPGLPAAAWFAGQVEAAKAGLALHADRCDRVNRGEAVAWPELAEWNCYSCHHDLTPRSADWRGRRADARVRRSDGLPLWTGGNLSQPLRHLIERESSTFRSYDRLGKQAVRGGRPASDPSTARTLIKNLDKEHAYSRFKAADPAAGRKLVDALELKLSMSSGELSRLDWDDASQIYYALRAASRCGRPAGAQKDAADQALDRLASQLRLPRNPTVNSPVQYDPASVAKGFAEFNAAFNARPAGR